MPTLEGSIATVPDTPEGPDWRTYSGEPDEESKISRPIRTESPYSRTLSPGQPRTRTPETEDDIGDVSSGDTDVDVMPEEVDRLSTPSRPDFDGVAFTPQPEFDKEIDIAFVLDSSFSVSRAEFRKTLRFVEDFIEPLDINDGKVRLGIIRYSDKISSPVHMNSYQSKQDLINMIRRIRYDPGESNMAGGFRALTKDMFRERNGDRRSVPDAAVLVTGGRSTVNPTWLGRSAQAARKRGISLYGVAVGMPDTLEVDSIVSSPIEKHRYSVRDFDSFNQILDDVRLAIFSGKSKEDLTCG